MSTDYAAIITFPSKSTAYEAFSKLTTSATGVQQAAVLERTDDGQLRVADASDPSIDQGFAGGSLIGALVGILGGPLGMLLGWATGASIGSLMDIDRAETSQDVLSEFGAKLPAGTTALIIQGDDAGRSAVEAVVSELGGTFTARPVDEVIDEIEAQQQAASDAADAARKALRAHKRDERKEAWQQRWDKLKSDLGGKADATA